MSDFVFFFNVPATPELYTLSLHDALPICSDCQHIKPLFPMQSSIEFELPRLGSVPFDPGLAALSDRGGSLADTPTLASWHPVQQIAREICQRVSELMPAPSSEGTSEEKT